MATEKVSLSLDRETLREARGRVGRRGLSSYVDEALRIKLQHDRIRGFLSELDEIYGPVPSSVMSQVRREWLAESAPKRKARRR